MAFVKDAVNAARRRREGKLRVCPGLEIDYIRGLTGLADRDFKDPDLDYCIGSVQYIPGDCLFLFHS
jgi:histidinol phosphatase-like PHP family hydrolase